MSALLQRLRNDSGQAVVFVAVGLFALVGMAALVIDGGAWRQTQRHLQTAADAGALAGAQNLPTDQSGAGANAVSFAQQNFPGIAAPTVTFPSAGEIDVRATTTAPGVLARLYGAAFRTVTARGIKVVMATHDLGSARRLAGDIVLLHRGRIVERADAAAFFANPATREARSFVDEFTLDDGRRIYLVADGRLVNLSAAEGHPALVMDMSFANQALSAEYAILHAAELERRVYPVPEKIDREIARLKLETMGVQIDKLTEEQEKYLASWDEGT